MARTDIPTHVRELILRHIDSVQQVEILALVCMDPHRAWTTQAVSRALQIAHEPCGAWLDQFVSAGLLAGSDEGVRFVPEGKDARAATDLVDLFTRRRVTVVDSIYGKPDAAAQ